MSEEHLSYAINIYCAQCQQTVYERHGHGGAEYDRAIREANDARNGPLAAQHPRHQLQLDGHSKVGAPRTSEDTASSGKQTLYRVLDWHEHNPTVVRSWLESDTPSE